MDWLKNFAEQILDRGYDYYCDGAVNSLKKDGNTLTATVNGTNDYAVKITFDGDIITGMHCSCPYAEDGDRCKHMAATLFEWESYDTGNEEHTTEESSVDSAKGLVSSADIETVKEFLIQILENDEKLLIRFKNLSVPEISKADMQKYKEQIDRVVSKYLSRDHFIDYHAARGFFRAIEEFIDVDVQMMLDERCYLEAFELVCYIFTTVGNVDIDDSDGGTGTLAEHCYEIWLEILNKSDDNTKRVIYKWFTSHLDGSVIDYMEEYIERIIMEEFTEKEYLNAKLELTDLKAKEAEKQTDSWSGSYSTGRWVMHHIAIMEHCGYSWEEIEQYCTEHWNLSAVRRYYINQCIKQRNYDRAINVLKESIQLDSGFRGLITEYNAKLKEIYKLCGMHEQYLEQLWQLALISDAGDLETFRELKSQYSEEEWKEKREQLFAALPRNSGIDRLYKEEMLYDRLLEYVISSSGLYALREYRSDLENIYPQELLQKYRDEVENLASHTSNRSRYKELVEILRSMRKITGGTKVVDEIAAHWKASYSNRRAMMEELNHLY